MHGSDQSWTASGPFNLAGLGARNHSRAPMRLRVAVAALAVGALIAALMVTTHAAPSSWSVRIHAGGGEYTDASGAVWSPDEYFVGGSTWTHVIPIANTADQPLYQSERWGMTGYRIPVPASGIYTLHLRSAEIWTHQSGVRVFSVVAQGTVVESDLDLVKAIGFATAYEVTAPVRVTNGVLDLSFSATANAPKISAIEVDATAEIPAPTPGPTQAPTSRPTTSPTPRPPVSPSPAPASTPTPVPTPAATPSSGTHPAVPMHQLGGFEIESVADANLAHTLGLTEAQAYGSPAPPGSPLGLAIAGNAQHVWDSTMASSLYYYECNRLYATGLISKQPGFCGAASQYAGDDHAWLLAHVTSDLQAVQHDPEIDAYWALDDQAVLADPGTLRPVLQELHALVHQYTPTIPMICGFGAGVGYGSQADWYNPPLALAFSATACDAVAFYIYDDQVPGTGVPASGAFHWNLAGVVPGMLQSLRQQGWNQQATPLIGIPTAFGGVQSGGQVNVAPAPNDMVTEVQAFVGYGAVDILWYGFGTVQGQSGFSSYQSVTTSASLQQGVRLAGTAAQKVWQAAGP